MFCWIISLFAFEQNYSMGKANHMSKQISEAAQLQLSITHKIFPPHVIERTLFFLRDLITGFEVTDTSSDNLRICICRVSTDVPQDIEDIFYSRLISTAVSLIHDESSKDIKQDFIRTAMIATTEPQQVLKRHLMSQKRTRGQFPENRATYWDGYRGYRVELGGGFDIFMEEHTGTFHLDLDDNLYSLTHIQPIFEKMDSDGFEYTIHIETSRIIVSVTFQEGITQPVMLKTLLDLHRNLRTFGK